MVFLFILMTVLIPTITLASTVEDYCPPAAFGPNDGFPITARFTSYKIDAKTGNGTLDIELADNSYQFEIEDPWSKNFLPKDIKAGDNVIVRTRQVRDVNEKTGICFNDFKANTIEKVDSKYLIDDTESICPYVEWKYYTIDGKYHGYINTESEEPSYITVRLDDGKLANITANEDDVKKYFRGVKKGTPISITFAPSMVPGDGCGFYDILKYGKVITPENK
jgi:hypothetical protein